MSIFQFQFPVTWLSNPWKKGGQFFKQLTQIEEEGTSLYSYVFKVDELENYHKSNRTATSQNVTV